MRPDIRFTFFKEDMSNKMMGAAKVYLKLENMQNTGSFKIRGVANQLAAASGGVFVTMSAGMLGHNSFMKNYTIA